MLALQHRGRGALHIGVTKLVVSRISLERRTEEGESPVDENDQPPEAYPSNAELVEFCVNLGRPLPKAKHSN